MQGKFPKLPNDITGVSASNESEAYDLYILTGSHNGAYEDIQWIRDLEAWIRRADETKAKVLGICFGHQVVATAFGGTVTVNPKGWEIGAHEFELNTTGQAIFKGRKSIKLQYTHQDAVMQIPDSCTNLGGNANTQCQAMVKGHHIITVQGHPEFSQATMEGLLQRKLEGGIIDEPSYQIYHRSLEEHVDNDFVACSCLEYLSLHPSIEQTNQ